MAHLWHDNSGDPLPVRVRRAAARYEEEHGVRPTRCHVNPIHLDEGEMMIGIKLVADPNILPGYLWLEAGE